MRIMSGRASSISCRGFAARSARSPRPGDPVSSWPGEPGCRCWTATASAPEDPRALIVRRDLGDGRIWGTTSISLVALSRAGLRYDFSAAPGDPDRPGGRWQV